MVEPAAIVQAFVAAINARDPAALARLMTPDHLFVDSVGTRIQGREEIRRAWIAYFFMIPDYTMVVTQTFVKGTAVALFGSARGTYVAGGTPTEANRWEIPAAWLAVVREGLVSEWRVYADNEQVRQIIASASAPPDKEPAQ